MSSIHDRSPDRDGSPDRDDTPALLAEVTFLLLESGDLTRAGQVLEALAALCAGHPAADLLAGLVAFAGGRYGDAESRYRQLVGRHPDHEIGRAFLAESLIAQQRWREAGDLLATVRRDPHAVRLADSLAEGLRVGLFQQAAAEGGR